MARKDEEEQLENRVENSVWSPTVSTTWWLDKSTKCIEISRIGFTIVPDFASTIHGATCRTLSSGIPDVGAFKDKPSPASAMEGMFALSRVKRMQDVVIARPFPPGLFQQGPAVFPTLLLDVLKGRVSSDELDSRLQEAEGRVQAMQTQHSSVLLKNMHHGCGTCGDELGMSQFVKGRTGLDTWYGAVERDVFLHGGLCYPSCMPRESDRSKCLFVSRVQGLQTGSKLWPQQRKSQSHKSE